MNKAAQSLGRLGGKAGTGAAKARTSEQARAAVQARWEKHRKTKRVASKPNGNSNPVSFITRSASSLIGREPTKRQSRPDLSRWV